MSRRSREGRRRAPETSSPDMPSSSGRSAWLGMARGRAKPLGTQLCRHTETSWRGSRGEACCCRDAGHGGLIPPVLGEKEPAMNSTATDLVTLPSAHGETETVERLKALLAQKGIEVFAHIDHAAGARKVGLPLRPTQVLIFGNPKAGTPLMQSQQTIGLDLPLRVLVWEDGEGKVWLTYRRGGGARGGRAWAGPPPPPRLPA